MNFIIHHTRQFAGVFLWSFLRHRYLLPILTIVQVFFALAIVYGATLLMGDLDATGTEIVCVGTIELALIAIAISIAPQILSQSRTEKFLDYQKNLPIPRPLLLFSDFLIWILVATPGIFAIIIACWLRFGLFPMLSWQLFTVLLISIITYLALGYMLALWLPEAGTQVASQLLMITALLFAPILYPASRLPEWLNVIHDCLPFVPSRKLMGYYAFAQPLPDSNRLLFTLIVWLCVTLTLCLVGLSRRK